MSGSRAFASLKKKHKGMFVGQIDETGAFPSHAQTIRMRKALSRENAITKWSERLWKKKTESKKLSINFVIKILAYISQKLHNDQAEEFVIDALKYYTKCKSPTCCDRRYRNCRLCGNCNSDCNDFQKGICDKCPRHSFATAARNGIDAASHFGLSTEGTIIE